MTRNYTDYREWLKEQEKNGTVQPEKTIKPASAPTSEPIAPVGEKKRKASFKEKQEYEQLESEIEKLELRKETLVAEMNAGRLDHLQIKEAGAELKQINHDLEVKGERWLELGEIV